MMGEAGGVTLEEMDFLRAQFDLDKPLPVQLARYLRRLVQGDMGYSIQRARPVKEVILEAVPATIELALFSLLFALIVGIPLGIASARRQNSLIDRFGMTVSFLGISMPAFWLGIIGIIVFSLRLGWFPTSGRITYGMAPTTITGLMTLDAVITGNTQALRDALRHLALPATTLGAGVAAVVARVTRSSMLEALKDRLRPVRQGQRGA